MFLGRNQIQNFLWSEKINSSFYFQLTDINCPGDGKCFNQGTCDGKTGTCTCNNGFNGDNCESKYRYSSRKYQ